MLAQWRRLNRHVPSTCSQIRRISDLREFKRGDLVLLREKLNRSAPSILTKPLKPGRQVQSHRGVVDHDDIIGKRVRDVVSTTHGDKTRVGTEYRLHEVKLEEYVRLSRRLVTPIYPADARLIVEILDLHPSPASEHNGTESEKLEILEAGTGHGALTLYLSRAIHGANAPLPHATTSSPCELMDNWRCSRRAIIHTLDVKEKYCLHARDVVKGFRHGLYFHNIDFHVADVSSWVKKELESRTNDPFLSHAILDLPNSHLQLEHVAKALRVDGTLVVFNPSITQITQCASAIREQDIPLELERVVELPINGEAAGREWSVKAVRPKSSLNVAEMSSDQTGGSDAASEDQDVESESPESATTSAPNRRDEGWQVVCRPKVGDRIVGGGFVGVWKKQRESLE